MPLLVIATAAVVALLCPYTAVAAASAKYIQGQTPQFGNGFVATFANSTTDYAAGVFDGATLQSGRAGLPASTLLFPKDALASYGGILGGTYPFRLHEPNATVTLDGVTADGIPYRQHWVAPRRHRNLMATWIEAVLPPFIDNATANLTVSEPFLDPALYTDVNWIGEWTFAAQTYVTVYSTVTSEYPDSGLTLVAVLRYTSVKTADQRDDTTTYVVPIMNRNMTRVFTRISCTVSSLEFSFAILAADLALQAYKTFTTSLSDGFEAIVAAHLIAWADLWSHSVSTDSFASAAAIRASQYAIFSAVRADWPYSTSPGGLATNGYNGHTFWDMDTWVNPNLMLLHPDIALGSGLLYRINRLDGARYNANVTLGYPGASFPWESAFTGRDVCTNGTFAMTELHVTADFVLSARNYVRLLARGSAARREFLELVWPVLTETTRFWTARTDVSNMDGSVHLNNVTPPDEYHLVNDSIYTNYAVQQAVNFTFGMAVELERVADIADMLPAMMRIVSNITMVYNATMNYHPEYAGYDGEAVKQADVILLGFPLGMPMLASTALNDLDYYANHTSPDYSGASTMTWSMFSVGYFSLLDHVKGHRFFTKGYENNCYPPYWQWYQQVGGIGNDNFVTGAGGFIQSVWAGFLSMRIVEGGIELTPAAMACPIDGSRVDMTGVHLHGTQFDISVVRDTQSNDADLNATIVLSSDSPIALCVDSPFGSTLTLNTTGAFVTFRKSQFVNNTDLKVLLRGC
jgi:hypothetical protein